MAPGGGEFVNLVAHADAEGIVLEGAASTGERARWAFRDIAPDAFTWRGEASADGGATWRLEQEMRARRRPPAGRPSGAAPGVH